MASSFVFLLGEHLDERRGEEMQGVEGEEAIIRIYDMREKGFQSKEKICVCHYTEAIHKKRSFKFVPGISSTLMFLASVL